MNSSKTQHNTTNFEGKCLNWQLKAPEIPKHYLRMWNCKLKISCDTLIYRCKKQCSKSTLSHKWGMRIVSSFFFSNSVSFIFFFFPIFFYLLSQHSPSPKMS